MWHETRTGPGGRTNAHGQVGARLRLLLDEHVAAGRPLPGYQGRPSSSHLSGLLGCKRGSVDRYRQALEAAAAIVGVTDSAFVDDVQGRLDGEPWIEAITTHRSAETGLANLARRLQTACYLTIAFFSGMRDSENGAELHLMQHSAGFK